MKIFVKTFKGDRFEIQVKPEDSVADVKKNIETVLGVSAYPAAQQVLIHKGKVLEDETTLEANNVSENSNFGVMKVHAAPPSSTPPFVATSATETPDLSSELDLNNEIIPEDNIQQILQMVGGAWSREMVVNALGLAYSHVDTALEYLYFDLPEKFEDPFILEGERFLNGEPEAPEDADLQWTLDSLRGAPELEYLRALVHSDPGILKESLEVLEEQNQPLVQMIRNNKAAFLHLLLEQPQEPNNGGDSGNQVVGEFEETQVDEQPQADQINKPNNG